MTLFQFRLPTSVPPLPLGWMSWRSICRACLLLTILGCLLVGSPALAGLNDDRFDGEIFALYAGNGSLVPPKVTLEQSLKRDRPTVMVLYTDDSSDCKQYAIVISQVQAFYGRATDILPIRVDSIPVKSSYSASEPGHYYQGVVPQTVLFNASGKIVLDEAGVLPFERIDDVLRQVFDLLPRSESVELKRRQVNELTTELVKP